MWSSFIAGRVATMRAGNDDVDLRGSEQGRGAPALALLRAQWRAVFGVVLGAVLGLAAVRTSWGDIPALLGWTTAAAGVIAVVLLRRSPPPWPLALIGVSASAAVAASQALGASLAAATWFPVSAGLVLIGIVFPTALLGFVSALLFRDAGTLVVLSLFQGTAVYSGSTQYFLAFVGAVAAPLWFALNLRRFDGRFARAFAASGLVVSALAVWVVLVSGSRAALLALSVAALIGLGIVAVRRIAARTGLVPILGRLAVVAVLVGAIDFGLGAWFGDGGSTIARVLAPRVQSTVAEVERIERGPFGMRLALWREALTMVANRPQGHGPGSYGSINHAYQSEPMLWSGSPHSVWATTAIESGVLGLAALALLVGLGVWRSARRGRPEALALISAAVVMSLDIFDHMPFQATLWWLAIGAAWHDPSPPERRSRWDLASRVAIGAVVVLGLASAARLALPCEDGCDPIERYAGHLRLVSAAGVDVTEGDPVAFEDSRLARFYPLSYRHRYLVAARTTRDDEAIAASLLPDFPFHSAPAYLYAAERELDVERRADIAACGLEVFYGSRMVWRPTQRLSTAEFVTIGDALRGYAEDVAPSERACERAGIILVPLALR